MAADGRRIIGAPAAVRKAGAASWDPVRLLRAGATVAGLALAGRALGFARTVLVAALLGAGPATDAFFVAFRLFAVLRAPFSAGGVGAAFVPLFVRRLDRRGDGAARRFANEALAGWPRSSSMTSTRAQPCRRATSTRSYWRRWLSRLSRTCAGVDFRI